MESQEPDPRVASKESTASKQPIQRKGSMSGAPTSRRRNSLFDASVSCRGHGKPAAIQEIASELQKGLLESINQKLQSDVGSADLKGGMCQQADAHLTEIGSIGDCSSHVGYYSTAQIVANLLHLVVQLSAFPNPACVAEMEVQTESKDMMADAEIQCELDRREALKSSVAEVQTEPTGEEAETQTSPDVAEVETQTLVRSKDAELQTDERASSSAEVQAVVTSTDSSSQSMAAEACSQAQQTDQDGRCSCCKVAEGEIYHCRSCFEMMVSPSSVGQNQSHTMWNRTQAPTEHVSVQATAETTDTGLQAIAAGQDVELQVDRPHWCQKCSANPVETLQCEDCLDSLMAPAMMGTKSVVLHRKASAKNAPAPVQRSRTKEASSARIKEVETCEAGLQVSMPTECASTQAGTATEDVGSQVVAATRDKEVQEEAVCQRCNVNPVTCQECNGCFKISDTNDMQNEQRKGDLRGRLRGIANIVKMNRKSITEPITLDENLLDEKGEEDILQNEQVPPSGFLCVDCMCQEAFVLGGRCADCVSGKDTSPARQSSRGVRIGGGFDVLQVSSDRGRMVGAREAVQETVRSESPSRAAKINDDSPWQFVHGAPSAFSAPSRFHVPMLHRPACAEKPERGDVRLPPAGPKKNGVRAVEAEDMVRASLIALNRDGPSKNICGEPYLYRVMAPSARRPQSREGHRPSPR